MSYLKAKSIDAKLTTAEKIIDRMKHALKNECKCNPFQMKKRKIFIAYRDLSTKKKWN